MFEREPITAGELMDKQFLPKPVIVEGMLPAGTYILAGTPKIGKSFLMTQLLLERSRRNTFPGAGYAEIHRIVSGFGRYPGAAAEPSGQDVRNRLVRLRIPSAVSDQSARRRLNTTVSGFYS